MDKPADKQCSVDALHAAIIEQLPYPRVDYALSFHERRAILISEHERDDTSSPFFIAGSLILLLDCRPFVRDYQYFLEVDVHPTVIPTCIARLQGATSRFLEDEMYSDIHARLLKAMKRFIRTSNAMFATDELGRARLLTTSLRLTKRNACGLIRMIRVLFDIPGREMNIMQRRIS